MTDGWNTLYWTGFVASVVAASVVVGLAALGRLQGRRGALLVLSSIALVLLAGRWPSMFIPGWLNPDESMMLAQALKFTSDPVPWRAMDPGTGGPMNSYLLLPLHWLGMDVGYPLARATAIACLVAYLACLFLAMRRVAGIAAAAVVLLPAAVFHAVGTKDDMLHYSSEMASLVSLGLVAFAASRLGRSAMDRRAEMWWSIATGVCAFIVTMSKLQGVPLGAALSVSILALLAPDLKTFVRRLAFVLLGGVAAAASLLALLAATGVLHDFRVSFLELPFTYTNTALTPGEVATFMRNTPDSRRYSQAVGWMMVVAVLAWPAWVHRERWQRMGLRLGSLLLVGVAMFVTLSQPGRAFPHYLSYLTVGGCWLLLLLLPWAGNVQGEPDGERRDA